MNTQTTELLKQLADKLGTTTNYLWNVLVNHAHVSAEFSLINILVMLGYIYFTIRFYKKNKYQMYALGHTKK